MIEVTLSSTSPTSYIRTVSKERMSALQLASVESPHLIKLLIEVALVWGFGAEASELRTYFLFQ